MKDRKGKKMLIVVGWMVRREMGFVNGRREGGEKGMYGKGEDGR